MLIYAPKAFSAAFVPILACMALSSSLARLCGAQRASAIAAKRAVAPFALTPNLTQIPSGFASSFMLDSHRIAISSLRFRVPLLPADEDFLR